MYVVHYKLLNGTWQVCICTVLSDFFKFFEGQYTDHYVEEV